MRISDWSSDVCSSDLIRLETYKLGYGPEGRWTSFSVAKSFTSTLVGAAVKDGYIKSLDDKVSAYIPGLKGSAYDDVSVRQLQIGRASCRERCVSTCRSRWSPYH